MELPSLRLLAAVHLLQQTLCTRPMYVEVDDDIVRAAVLQLISQTAHSDTPSETDDAQINFNSKRARGRTESICSYHIPANVQGRGEGSAEAATVPQQQCARSATTQEKRLASRCGLVWFG